MSEEEAKGLGLETPEEEEEVVVSSTMSEKERLISLVGDEGYNTLESVAKSIGKPVFDTEDAEGNIVKGFIELFEEEEALDSIEVLQGKSRNATNFVVYTTNSKGEQEQIDLSHTGLEGAGTGYAGYAITTLYDNTVSDIPKALETGQNLSEVFKSKLSLGDIENTQREHDQKLSKIQSAMTILGDVFGFDDQEHLEMFMAAWLMRDSTCRLSGIPGTGKTTVIEAASILLCNSYGFDTHQRFVAPKGRAVDDISQLFGADRTHVPDLYKQGQLYDLSYSNNDYRSVHEGWDAWRFTNWQKPGGSTRSGAYLYDFLFLQMMGTGSDGNEFKKRKMEADDFSKLLTNCYVAQVPVEGFRHPGVTSDGVKTAEPDEMVTGSDLLKLLPDEEVTHLIAPIKLLNADGTPANYDDALVATVSCGNLKDRDGTPLKFHFEMRVRYPECRFKAKNKELDYAHILNPPQQDDEYGAASEFMQEGYGLFTDAGRSEGYGLRQFLQTYYYDGRLTDNKERRGLGLKQILEEMLQENGVAKIDYEKRADEVLYGIEIQQSTHEDPVRDKTISTYEFEPVPRPIVTQPIKFFNEANRSQAGVEDAVLGLIAERKVEYRGKTFDSPHFVAWMDTNPHQKGNDLAFIDRIDMELLFKSISLGSRYTVLSGTYGKGGGYSPQLQVVNKLAIDGLAPMRFNELNSMWSFIGNNNKIGYTPPGQNPGSATYDALREISYISVLFTQKWAGKNYELRSNETFEIGERQSMKSPLMDFSTVTNTTSTGGVQTPIEDYFAEQPPAQFDRVLGFRFTNSLVKLSSALAFLRGRSYVTRSEILDGLPYVTAHRLGRAKTAADESRGLNKDLNYENEQQWVREAIVNGYLLSKNSTRYAQSNLALMDIWDLYYRRCVDNLKSSPTLFWYEAQVISPLRRALTSDSLAEQMTPVHWHIATMVMENERTATPQSSTKPYRNYKHGNDYMENYNYYRNRIFSKPTPGKETVNLYDYFKLRGEICQEPNLFSDDRETLLAYLESRMATIAGANSDTGSVSNPIATTQFQKQALQETIRTSFGLTISPTQFPWRTYQDSIGAWGRLLQLDGASGTAQITNFAEDRQTSVIGASSFTDQAMMISGRMECREPKTTRTGTTLASHSSLASQNMLRQIENLRSAFASSSLGEGVLITSPSEGSELPITLEDFLDYSKGLVTEYPQQKEPGEDFIIGGEASSPFHSDQQSVNVAGDGLLGCFPLKHAGGAPSADPRYKGENDFLRLWIRVFRSSLSPKQDASVATENRHMTTLNLTMGITSNFADGKDNMISMTGPFAEDTNPYKTENFTNDDLVDIGNLSLTDILQYQVVFDNAVTTEELN
tara:strand:- start:431 stop:4483 length:4053 start_codon:yes stop_codon:yes gene_type:complete